MQTCLDAQESESQAGCNEFRPGEIKSQHPRRLVQSHTGINFRLMSDNDSIEDSSQLCMLVYCACGKLQPKSGQM